MTNTATNDTARQEAVARLSAKRALTAAFVSYLIANAVVWTVWALTGPNTGMPWPLWITGFGALGLVGQAWHTFGDRPIRESDIEREMQRQQ